MTHQHPFNILSAWRSAMLASVRSDAPDLTQRQMALLLTVYLDPPPHTVRGLAATLGVSKPVITRAVDSLSGLGLLRRKRDTADRRNVFVQRTVKGAVFLSDFSELMSRAEGERIQAVLGRAA